MKIKVPVECYSRVVGYFRPVNQWNKGMQAQFKDRHTHDVEKIKDKLEKIVDKIDICDKVPV